MVITQLPLPNGSRGRLHLDATLLMLFRSTGTSASSECSCLPSTPQTEPPRASLHLLPLLSPSFSCLITSLDGNLSEDSSCDGSSLSFPTAPQAVFVQLVSKLHTCSISFNSTPRESNRAPQLIESRFLQRAALQRLFRTHNSQKTGYVAIALLLPKGIASISEI